MLTVWCVCVGDKYSDEDVYILRDMVARHCNIGYEFVCLSDRKIPGVDCLVLDVVWPGWWSKLLLFKHAAPGQNLYFDLDVVITGEIPLPESGELCMPKNWAQSGHGGCQSSVMSWRGGSYRRLADNFDPSLLHDAKGNYGFYGDKNLWGDQEYIFDLLSTDAIEVTSIVDTEPRYVDGDPWQLGCIREMSGVKSYKYHCKNGLPEDAWVVCFHGLPKPHQINDQWVKDARRCSRQSIA